VARTLNRLSNLKVERAKRPGMYADGGGLYLRIAEGGSRQWIFRYATNGRLRDMGIGPCHTLTLAEARKRATDARKLRLDGIDPIAHKHAQRAAAVAEAAKAMTFKQCAEGYIKDNEAEWTNAKHRHEWSATLARYVYPVLGDLPVATIDTPLVLKVIKPLWQRAPETASRVRGRIENVLGWATVHHYRAGDNPARWRGLLEHALPARNKVARVQHHAALPYAQAADFMAKVRKDTRIIARCLEFVGLTAVRVGEANVARWPEIDFQNRVWTIPGERMGKSHRKEHRIPLSNAALAVLDAMRAVRHSDYIFPGQRNAHAVGANSVLRVAKEAAGFDITTHGLRSTFRDWAAEQTNYPNHVVEQALAHAIPNAVEAAYRRGDLFEKRRRLMDAWAEYCRKQNGAGAVVPLRGAS
jgi:integrase